MLAIWHMYQSGFCNKMIYIMIFFCNVKVLHSKHQSLNEHFLNDD
jgi:hypothetical protein